MANNYCEFSETLAIASDEEQNWLLDQLEDVPTNGYDCPKFLVGSDFEDWGMVGFDLEFETAEDGARYAWIHVCESGNPDAAAVLVQNFLKQFHPDDCWTLTYSSTCSKPRIGEFGGGGVFVTADKIEWMNAHDFCYQKVKEFNDAKKQKDVPDA